MSVIVCFTSILIAACIPDTLAALMVVWSAFLTVGTAKKFGLYILSFGAADKRKKRTSSVVVS